MPGNDNIPSRHSQRGEFERLWESAKSDVLWAVMRIIPYRPDAEEIVQQTATILWEKFAAYDRNQPFPAWACGISRNVARRWATERERWMSIDDDFVETVEQSNQELQEELEWRLRYLERCLDKLPKDQGCIVRDYYLLKLEVDEIAEIRDRTIDSVYKTLQRSLKKLQDCIVKSSEEEGGT